MRKTKATLAPRRRYHKKRVNRVRKRLIGFPTTQIVKHRYVTNQLLDLNSVPLVNVQYSATGMFDPQISVGGHQPLGYDQWSLFYNRYHVLGCKAKITFNFGESTGSKPLVVGIYPLRYGATVGTSVQAIMEQGLSRFKMVNSSPGGGADNQFTLVNKLSTKQFYDQKDSKDNTISYGAMNTANPNSQIIWNIFAGTYDESSGGSASKITCMIELDYIARWSDPIALPQS